MVGEGDGALTDFEAAQTALLKAAGLEWDSSFVALDRPAVSTHVFETGTRDADGTPIVFLHGTAAFGAFLAPLLSQLDEYRLVGFDRPGHGLSGPYEYDADTIRQTAGATIESVLDELAIDRVDLVGHSMGAFGGIEFTRRYPERVRTLSLLVPVLAHVPDRTGFSGTVRGSPSRWFQPRKDASIKPVVVEVGSHLSVKLVPFGRKHLPAEWYVNVWTEVSPPCLPWALPSS